MNNSYLTQNSLDRATLLLEGVYDFTRCQRPNGTYYGTAGKCRKGVEVGYSNWREVAKGNYGAVAVSPDGSRAVKTLLTHNGKKGEFGDYEVELAEKMGEMGHSPRVHSHDEDHLEMDFVKGRPLWNGYARREGEPQMNTAQATKAVAAIRDLHKMGFFHGDMHALQFMVDKNDVKLVDFGLSGKTSTQPSRVLQDLSKIASLINWRNPELAGDPYVQTVNKYLSEYKTITGTSKKAKERRTTLANEYLAELESL